MTTIKNLTTGETITREFTEAQLGECIRDGFTVIQNFQAIEDNGGGLHLFVLGDQGEVVWAGANYEYMGSDLKDAVEALMSGADPIAEGWEDNIEALFGEYGATSQSFYDEFTDEDHRNGGWELIADQNGIYPDRMGCNAREAFGIVGETDYYYMSAAEKIAYIDSLPSWDAVDAEYYEALCNDLGLDYSDYDDPDAMWADIQEAAKEAR